MLTKNILYAVKLLAKKSEFKSFGRTIVQKIMFFALPSEKRKLYYIPFFYGPYSDNIQLLLRSLENTEYLFYKNQSYELSQGFKFKSTNAKLAKRIKSTINFLTDNNITSTKDVSNLAKVYMILDENNLLVSSSVDAHVLPFIKQKALSVGWKELSNLNNKRISTYIDKAINIEQEFVNNNLN